MRALVGVLVRAVKERELTDVCRVDQETVRSFEPEWIEVDAVREFLDHPARVRADAATLKPRHVEAIEAFDGAINGWLAECKRMATNDE